MKTFKVKFIKDGLDYETIWKAESQQNCINEIETQVLKGKLDYESLCPQNVIYNIKEEQQ